MKIIFSPSSIFLSVYFKGFIKYKNLKEPEECLIQKKPAAVPAKYITQGLSFRCIDILRDWIKSIKS